ADARSCRRSSPRSSGSSRNYKRGSQTRSDGPGLQLGTSHAGPGAGVHIKNKEEIVARTSWFDDKAEHPVIQEQLEKLESFTSALADGVISESELSGQEQRLVAAMKKLEPQLGDELHEKVTSVLIELTGYNVMRLLRELQAERARAVFGRP